ncbi:uncharacterized protein At5g64816-like isoform X1 [Cucurbita maxima]|uniref:Uncharacterized protein At5g64816-like isoform X1 n=2 Tax=Cucurbita maxima TaxID=3661 RepID=A0A6J1IJU3_CUCMA|nr:uncharacterized protein At5g64816-like isoform X1 [Cucurbita maxima]
MNKMEGNPKPCHHLLPVISYSLSAAQRPRRGLSPVLCRRCRIFPLIPPEPPSLRGFGLTFYSCCFRIQGRRELMVEVWWSILGAAIPAVVAGQAYRMRRRHSEEQKIKTARGREKNPEDIFVCERVCTSKRMLKKVGSFSKDPIPDTCMTVCGLSELDACTDACARTVCVNQHQVPNWNDICLRRCQSECLKLSASHSS